MCIFNITREIKRPTKHPFVKVPAGVRPQHEERRSRIPGKHKRPAKNSRQKVPARPAAEVKVCRKTNKDIMKWNDGFDGGQPEWADPNV